MPTPNDKLRKARQRTSSSANPDEGLSRQELAELVNTWIWEHHHKQVALNASYIGKLEQGVIRWPGKLYRESLRAVLGVPTDAALGFVNTLRVVVKLDNVKRRNLIETATALGVSGLVLGDPVAALLLESSDEPTPIPARVGATDIEQIRSATQEFKSWSRLYGGGLVRDAALGHLRWSARLLTESLCPERLRPELHSAVGALAVSVGYMTVDAGAPAEEARRAYRVALYCAEQAKDWNLRAIVLSCMAEQAVWTGQPDDGLTLAELALVRPDRLTATGRALLHTDRALALATMRRVQETLRAIGTADEHFAHATPDNEPSFLARYTTAHYANYFTGRPLVDLAILGRDPGEATTRLTAAIAGFPEGEVRSRAVCLTKLASLTMATGDPLQAVTLGNEALEIADTLRSRRTTDHLRDLVRYAAAHQDLEEVAHLRHRIAALVGTDNP